MSSISILFAVLLQAATPVAVPGIDDVLAEWTSSTPGCAVGVEVDGKTVLEKGFGMADLERSVPNRRDDLRGGLGVQAVHRGRGAAARARRQAVARRSDSRKVLPEIPDYVRRSPFARC